MNLDNEDCPICLENIINISTKLTLDCEHYFHKECIDKYFDTTCPICKQPFMNSNIYYINNIKDSLFKNVILLKNSIFSKLNNFFSFDNTLLFFKLLNRNAVLSGNFILSIIQNLSEDINELDIYIDNYYQYRKITYFLKKNNYKKTNCHLMNSINYISLLNNSNQGIMINNIKKYKLDNLQINIIFNNNNEYTIKYLFKLDILKNYFDGHYFYIYDISKIELKTDYIIKDKIDNQLKNLILYYRNLNYKILITE